MVCINKDRLRKSGQTHQQKIGIAPFSLIMISDPRVGDAKNGFRNDFLDAFYIMSDRSSETDNPYK